MAARRRSREEWREVVAAWRKSGMSQKEFARRHGMARSTLAWWSSELGRGTGETLNEAFVAVEVRPSEPTATAPTDRPVAVVEAANARLLIHAEACPRWVASVVAELARC